MTTQTAHRVTRRPAAPPRRAGRVWAEGETLVTDLSPAQVAAIAADPGYAIAPHTPEPASLPDSNPAGRGKPRKAPRARTEG